MHIFSRFQPAVIAVMVIVSLIFILTRCMNPDTTATDVITNAKGEQFAGSASCGNCHKAILENHLQSAHFLTSGIASRANVMGSFDTGNNTYAYDREHKISMLTKDNIFYQVEYFQNKQQRSRSIDIVFGSGIMGQSYLNWNDNHLLQLPVTYFSAAHAWSNSPGYPNKIIFNRPITSRCLECHSTYAKTISAPGEEPEKFDPTKMIYGVDCEKCHGPAAKHVEYQTANPAILTAKYVINPANFNRQQNLDLCASCHGGRLEKNQPSFTFSAGDTLSHFFALDTVKPNLENIDVHGNQYGLMKNSKCFLKSETMTCSTCHNAHENERGNTALYSQRCMSCHTPEHNFCTMAKTIGETIKTNCIDCHMPLKPSKAIAVYLPGGAPPVAALIRSHYISIYPEETKKMLAFIQRTN